MAGWLCYPQEMGQAASLYLHIPFCKKRCHYCDFNTVAGFDGQIEHYFRALTQEIKWISNHHAAEYPIHTVYFGGGTPSYVKAELIAALTETIRGSFQLLPGSEITLEANPGTLTQPNLERYLEAGINRLSLGVQSANEDELIQMGRIHTFMDAVENINLARHSGFENLSLDLIYGLPGQGIQSWMESLQKVTGLNLEHLSLYSLTIEEGTPFGRWVSEGKMQLPDEDLMADLFTAAQVWLDDHGYEQYEISNWCRRDPHRNYQSRHNCQYWLNQPYLGCGAGAHSCINGQRIANHFDLQTYQSACLTHSTGLHPVFPACLDVDEIDSETEMKETMMLGLRLLQQGVSQKEFARRYGKPMQAVFHREIADLLKKGLVEWLDEDRLVLSRQGVLLGNQVFMQFV